MKITTLKFSEISEADYNPRTITNDEFEGLIKSIQLFGQAENFVVNKREVNGKPYILVSGHQRIRAMKELGYYEAEFEVREMSEEDEKLLNVTLNNQKIQGKFDPILLDEMLEPLKLNANYGNLRLGLLESLDLSGHSTDVEVDQAELDGDKSLKFELIFDTLEQQKQFVTFIGYLKANVEGETVAERLMSFINENH